MLTKITFTVPRLTNEQRDMVRILFADALSEFVVRRTPPRLYAEGRYPHLTEPMVVKKAEQVKQRVEFATMLHHAAFDFDISDVQGLLPGHVLTVEEFLIQQKDSKAACDLSALLEGRYDGYVVDWHERTWRVTTRGRSIEWRYEGVGHGDVDYGEWCLLDAGAR